MAGIKGTQILRTENGMSFESVDRQHHGRIRSQSALLHHLQTIGMEGTQRELLERVDKTGSPVVPVMRPTAHPHLIADALFAECLDEVHVALKCEVMITTVDKPAHLFPSVHLVGTGPAHHQNRIVALHHLLPPLALRIVLEEVERLTAQIARHVVDHREQFGMVNAVDHSTTASHGEATHETIAAVSDDRIGTLNIGQELGEEEILVTPLRIVEPYHVLFVSLRTNDDHRCHLATTNQTVHHLFQMAMVLPLGVGTPATVEQIGNGELPSFCHAVGQINSVVHLRHATQQSTGSRAVKQRPGHRGQRSQKKH